MSLPYYKMPQQEEKYPIYIIKAWKSDFILNKDDIIHKKQSS